MSYHPHFRTIGDEQLTTERIAVSFYQLYLFICDPILENQPYRGKPRN